MQSPTTWFALNGSDDFSPSGINDIRTGAPLFVGGLLLGVWFDMTEQEANDHSWTDVGILHTGRFRRVRIHPNATAANIRVGKVGFMAALPIPPATIPDVNIVTTGDTAGGPIAGVRPVVFLNTVQPGNYCFIQELGIASVMTGAGATGAAGAGVAPPTGSGDGTVHVAAAGAASMGAFLAPASAHALVLALLNGVPIVQG